MSCEYKSISCLFQVFISQSLCFSLSHDLPPPWHSSISLFTCRHTRTAIIFCRYCSLPFSFSFSLLISLSVILLFFFLTICTIILSSTERGGFYEKVSVGQTDRRLTSWQGEGQPGERGRESLGVAAGIKV